MPTNIHPTPKSSEYNILADFISDIAKRLKAYLVAFNRSAGRMFAISDQLKKLNIETALQNIDSTSRKIRAFIVHDN